MSTLGERLEGLVAKWQVEHSEALSQAKGETDDQAYIGWMRLAAVTRNHMIELEAALRGEGQGDARLDEAKLRAALDADGLSRLECGHVKYNLIGDDWGNFSCDACAAAPSLHKEGCQTCHGDRVIQSKPAGAGHSDDLEEYIPCPDCAALHKEGAGGEPEERGSPAKEIELLLKMAKDCDARGEVQSPQKEWTFYQGKICAYEHVLKLLAASPAGRAEPK